jgi:hypothetical protein
MRRILIEDIYCPAYREQFVCDAGRRHDKVHHQNQANRSVICSRAIAQDSWAYKGGALFQRPKDRVDQHFERPIISGKIPAAPRQCPASHCDIEKIDIHQ